MAKPLKRRRVVPKKRTSTQQAAYNKQQKKTPKRGMLQDNLGKLKADAARDAKNMPKPKGGERILTPAQKYATKPGNPNYRNRSNTQPASRPLTPPEQQRRMELQKQAQKAASNMVKLNKQTPTSSKLARRRALPIISGTPRANPYGSVRYTKNMQPIGRAADFEIARYEAEQAMRDGALSIPSGYVFANPRLNPNYAPPPMTPPQQDIARTLKKGGALNPTQFSSILQSIFGKRP